MTQGFVRLQHRRWRCLDDDVDVPQRRGVAAETLSDDAFYTIAVHRPRGIFTAYGETEARMSELVRCRRYRKRLAANSFPIRECVSEFDGLQ